MDIKKIMKHELFIICLALTPVLLSIVIGIMTLGELSKRDKFFSLIEAETKSKQSQFFESYKGNSLKIDALIHKLELIQNNELKKKEVENKINHLNFVINILKSHDKSISLVKCIQLLNDASSKLDLLVLEGADNEAETLRGIRSNLECKDSKEGNINVPKIRASSTYVISIILILVSAITGSIFHFVREYILFIRDKNGNKGKKYEQPSFWTAFANGIGVGIVAVLLISWGEWSFASIKAGSNSGAYLSSTALVVLVSFLGGLYSKDVYDTLASFKNRLMIKAKE